MVYERLAPLFFADSLIVLYELAENIYIPTTLRLLENAVCQQHYANLESGRSPVPEELCKIDQVQAKLAYIRGLDALLKTFPG